MDWVADANGYRSEWPRYGPTQRPTIAVGEPTDDGIAFAPAVIEVAPLTEVTWDWTGHGGQHNVVALDGSFDSGRTNAQAGTCFTHFFSEPGTHAFVSEPDRDAGMRGAVLVREPPTTGYEAVDEWLLPATNFDGSIADRTDAETATVSVGTFGNRGAFAFSPPVLKISPGTRVSWDWTGNGGGHNVVFEDAAAGDDEIYAGGGVHLEHTFEAAGIYRYSCKPHHSLGMRGAIIVE
jgi:halocyanin-like protein